MEGYLEIFGRIFCGKKRKFRVMEKEIIFWGLETLISAEESFTIS